MGFNEIELTLSDRRNLRRSAKKPVKAEKCERLLRYHLVEEDRRHIPGRMPERLGTVSITDQGRDYLVHYRAARRREFLIPIIVSIVTSSIVYEIQLSWPQIRVWILTLLSEVFYPA